jgi:formylglycine-generating enzyme required for sulfatase activity
MVAVNIKLFDVVFVSIPGGTFQMGDVEGGGSSDEKTVHKVTLTGFKISNSIVSGLESKIYL